jgi:hypothetical protein
VKNYTSIFKELDIQQNISNKIGGYINEVVELDQGFSSCCDFWNDLV